MLLYRAINLEDLKNLKENNDIECSLIKTFNEQSHSNVSTYYDLCILKERQYALDTIAGHVMGGRLRVGLSPRISTSKDFNFVCGEYAIPQAGAYNESGLRKPVIIIERDNILDNTDEIKELRNNKTQEDIVIDLSDGKLNKFYKNAFMSEAYNENMPGYNIISSLNYELDPDSCNINGINNYALNAKEVVFFKHIKKNEIKFICYPLVQDIFYGCNIDIQKCLNYISKNSKEINDFLYSTRNLLSLEEIELFDYLYPNIESGNNLIDYLYDNYDNIDGDNIYNKYEQLKNIKKDILNKIIVEFNKKFNANLSLKKLVDDEVLVLDMELPIEISKKQIYDVLIIKHDNVLYKYDPATKNYSYEKMTINKQLIKQLTKKN